jgi:hypothetical protein
MEITCGVNRRLTRSERFIVAIESQRAVNPRRRPNNATIADKAEVALLRKTLRLNKTGNSSEVEKKARPVANLRVTPFMLDRTEVATKMQARITACPDISSGRNTSDGATVEKGGGCTVGAGISSGRNTMALLADISTGISSRGTRG